MTQRAEFKNTLIVCALRFMELAMQTMVFALALMLILIGFFSRENESVLKCFAVMGIPVAALFFIRGWCKSQAVTIAVHAGCILFAVLIAVDAMERVSYMIVITALLIYSGMLIINEKGRQGEQMPVGMIALFISALFVGAMTECRTIEACSLYCGIAFILIQVVYHNLNNMNDIMLMNREISNFPARSMVSVNLFIMSIVGVLCVGAMVLVNNQYVYRMVEGLGSIFIILLRYMLKFLLRKDEEPDIDEDLTNKEKPQPDNELFAQEWQGGLLEDILNGIAIIIGIVLIVTVIICLAAAFVRLMRRFRGTGNAEGDIKEFIVPQGINTYRIHRRKKEEDGIRGSGNIKARKLYKSIVKKGAAKKGTSIDSNMMPEEISSRFIAHGADEATAIYEKARYSDTQVSEEEVELLKKLRKK